MEKLKAGIIGCGNISAIYFTNCALFKQLEMAACADLDLERARVKAKEFGVPKACTVEELLADPEIEIVINLTIPAAHGDVCLQALEAGKHVYVEKPLSITAEDGKKVLETAAAKGLLVGGAPDTFLGGGLQTCRKLIDDGWIGAPVSAAAFMTSHGVESWHPNPDFFYQPGGGPLFDMGPYYLTALVSLIGPMKRVTGSARISFPERKITSEPNYGQTIEVNTPTHIAGVLDFENGAVGSLITSFDVWGAKLPFIEIYGESGTLSVPDPNTFGGPVFVRKQNDKEWREVPLTHGYTANSRGIGAADMAEAILEGREHRANGRMTYHVLEAMSGLLEASKEGRHYHMQSTFERPKSLAMHHQF
ncbi:MAG TPA: Gfo/Idh/MocA family oxidoreductase [Bacillales bacterium]|nr:Gfo/Idh/MocA family oxidoreductase [Bacillales bacterium]